MSRFDVRVWHRIISFSPSEGVRRRPSVEPGCRTVPSPWMSSRCCIAPQAVLRSSAMYFGRSAELNFSPQPSSWIIWPSRRTRQSPRRDGLWFLSSVVSFFLYSKWRFIEGRHRISKKFSGADSARATYGGGWAVGALRTKCDLNTAHCIAPLSLASHPWSAPSSIRLMPTTRAGRAARMVRGRSLRFSATSPMTRLKTSPFSVN